MKDIALVSGDDTPVGFNVDPSVISSKTKHFHRRLINNRLVFHSAITKHRS